MHYMETHSLLPEHHFGGRRGQSTTDTMHLLTCKIKDTWRKKEVAAVLFLDIKGAFPNAISKCLEHSMRKCRVPTKLASFTYKMLQNHTTVLCFNNYTSKPIAINNRIGQGDPFSMALYQFYNADIINTPKSPNEAAKAFIDNTLLITTAKTFTEVHGKLYDMMTRSRGIIEWSTTHNSPL
jgi:Reverse transcriptase (RNA-dependent DNA polymerase)